MSDSRLILEPQLINDLNRISMNLERIAGTLGQITNLLQLVLTREEAEARRTAEKEAKDTARWEAEGKKDRFFAGLRKLYDEAS